MPHRVEVAERTGLLKASRYTRSPTALQEEVMHRRERPNGRTL
jgi:hypothetical protein